MSHKQLITAHYDKKETTTKKLRKLSPIYNFRNFCNFVKAELINKYVKSGDRVLDLCAGKGADINKLMSRKISEYVAIDISSKSIEEAKRRIKKSFPRFRSAYFLVLDAFGENFLEDEKFDVISCQFAFHYAFENEERLDYAFRNINLHLEPRGYFIITIPDPEIIKKKMNHGNKYYKITYEQSNVYHFWLIGSIDVSEFIADRGTMIRYANKYNLKLVEEHNFLKLYNENLKSLNSYKAAISSDDNDQIELLSLYKSMVFQLR